MEKLSNISKATVLRPKVYYIEIKKMLAILLQLCVLLAGKEI